MSANSTFISSNSGNLELKQCHHTWILRSKFEQNTYIKTVLIRVHTGKLTDQGPNWKVNRSGYILES